MLIEDDGVKSVKTDQLSLKIYRCRGTMVVLQRRQCHLRGIHEGPQSRSQRPKLRQRKSQQITHKLSALLHQHFPVNVQHTAKTPVGNGDRIFRLHSRGQSATTSRWAAIGKGTSTWNHAWQSRAPAGRSSSFPSASGCASSLPVEVPFPIADRGPPRGCLSPAHAAPTAPQTAEDFRSGHPRVVVISSSNNNKWY